MPPVYQSYYYPPYSATGSSRCDHAIDGCTDPKARLLATSQHFLRAVLCHLSTKATTTLHTPVRAAAGATMELMSDGVPDA